MEIRDIRRAVLPEREIVSVAVLRFLSHRSLIRAQDITRHIITLGIVTLPDEMTELQLYWFRSGISAFVYNALRSKKLICTEGRYKDCPKFTQFRITDDGLKFLSEYDSGLSPSLLSWNPSGIS